MATALAVPRRARVRGHGGRLLAEVERLGPSVFEYPEPQTPAERAQDLVFRSGGATGRRRTQLLRKAFAMSPDCVDACVQLGEISRDAGQVAGALRGRPGCWRARDSGGRARQAEGGLLGARPDAGAAPRLIWKGDSVEGPRSAGGGQRRVPDAYGTGRGRPRRRGLHTSWRCCSRPGRDAEASDLLSRFDHEGPEWAYGRTLWAFRNRTRQDAREALQLGLDGQSAGGPTAHARGARPQRLSGAGRRSGRRRDGRRRGRRGRGGVRLRGAAGARVESDAWRDRVAGRGTGAAAAGTPSSRPVTTTAVIDGRLRVAGRAPDATGHQTPVVARFVAPASGSADLTVGLCGRPGPRPAFRRPLPRRPTAQAGLKTRPTA